MRGRQFFEEIIRENLDLGRPDKVQLIFDRRINRRTPGRFRTRVLTDGVVPALHVDYKHSKIKQYHKEGRALRTETTINNTYDFQVGRLLKNLGALRQIGFNANRHLLCVQTLSYDCLIGDDRFQHLTQPVKVEEQRASALRFGDPRSVSVRPDPRRFASWQSAPRRGSTARTGTGRVWAGANDLRLEAITSAGLDRTCLRLSSLSADRSGLYGLTVLHTNLCTGFTSSILLCT